MLPRAQVAPSSRPSRSSHHRPAALGANWIALERSSRAGGRASEQVGGASRVARASWANLRPLDYTKTTAELTLSHTHTRTKLTFAMIRLPSTWSATPGLGYVWLEYFAPARSFVGREMRLQMAPNQREFSGTHSGREGEILLDAYVNLITLLPEGPAAHTKATRPSQNMLVCPWKLGAILLPKHWHILLH